MKPEITLKHEFVEYIPNQLQERTIYVSIPFATVAHKCCCGCGNEVVTPLSPTDWKLTFDGQTVSLDPSIGNWSFACQSHYWITRNRVKWAERWSKERIQAGRDYDAAAKQRQMSTTNAPAGPVSSVDGRKNTEIKKSWWSKLKSWFS